MRAATGSVKQDKRTGKYIAHLRHEYLGTFDTEQAAWDRVNARKRLDAGKAPDLLSIYSRGWMVDREESGDVRGIRSEKSVWKQHIATARFYDKPLKKIATKEIEQWLIELSKKRKLITRREASGTRTQVGDSSLGRETIQHARRLLSQCFEAAVRDGKVAANPVPSARMPKLASKADEEEDEWTFLFVEEIAALFEAIEAVVPSDGHQLKPKALARLEQRRAFYRAVYAIAIYGGLRQGEIFGLHWEDIHFEQRGRGDRVNCIRVRRTRVMGRGPKTQSSKRSVPMLAPLRQALDAWRRHGDVLKTHGKVFPADGSAGQGQKPKELGGYFSESYDAAWEARWRRQATGRGYVTFHDLRHTCASHLVMGTWGLPLSPVEVAAWLGHGDLKTTQRYMHLAPGSLNDVVRQMEAGATPAELARRHELARQETKYGRH